MNAEARAPELMEARETCYRCHRPAVRCICALCRPVDNRTFVHVLQHPRERFHPFGTARIAELTLARVALHVAFGRTQNDTHHPLTLPPDTALLYPGRSARDVSALAPSERPSHLLVLDGTWRQAHQLFRDNPWLATMRRIALDPREPSRYRIRREPARHCLSTIESVAACLRALEPDTPGLDNLEHAFVAMIDQQVAYEWDRSAPMRHKRRRERASRAVPEALREQPERLVVVYGEPLPITTPRGPNELLQWTALRPATGETFERFIEPRQATADERLLSLMQLERADLGHAVSCERFVAEWRDFVRAGDVLVAWNASSLRLLSEAGVAIESSVMLKEAYSNAAKRRPGKLEAIIEREGLTTLATQVRGRARTRLGNAAAVLAWLRSRPLYETRPRSARPTLAHRSKLRSAAITTGSCR